jgi:hypothetical protein
LNFTEYQNNRTAASFAFKYDAKTRML